MRFRMFAASAHGKKYLERGLPCQDFSSTLEIDGVQAIAVADGHGGKDYFRSDTGSKLAVEIAFKQIKKFCSELSADEIFSDNGIKFFEHSLWSDWREAVINHWRENPVSADEARWQTVSEKYKARFTSVDEKYIPVAYGTTLICAVSIGAQVLITQIGDGSCVVLQRNGEFKVPVPPDSENNLNVTTSLCDSDAVSKFRHVVLNCDENFPLAPVAIFLSSDGLDDCYPVFENEKHLYKFYRETIIAGLIDNGFELTEREIHAELLPYMTARGSNDDISLAYLLTEDLNLLKAAVNVDAEKISPPVNINAEKILPPVNSDAGKISPLVNPDAEKISQSVISDAGKNSPPVNSDAEKISPPVNVDAGKISPPVNVDAEKISPPVNINAEKILPPVNVDAEKISQSVNDYTGKILPPVNVDAEKISQSVNDYTGKISPPVNVNAGKISPAVNDDTEKISPPVNDDTEKISPAVNDDTEKISPAVNVDAEKISQPVNVNAKKFSSSPVYKANDIIFLPPVKIESKTQSSRGDNLERF